MQTSQDPLQGWHPPNSYCHRYDGIWWDLAEETLLGLATESQEVRRPSVRPGFRGEDGEGKGDTQIYIS